MCLLPYNDESQGHRMMTRIIHLIELEPPFTALGFFDVQQSTLTAMASSILSYLIILVQFNPANIETATVPTNKTDM